MLQIRLNKGSAIDGGAGVKSTPSETVTVACPDHLVLSDLPVAKGLGSATSTSTVKTIGRRSRRQLGERVHFCVRCDFPISIYGRLSPCEHAFCLDCARSDSICYLCDERIQKIQTIKMMEGIFICAAPHCLKSFMKKTEFESHIHNCHNDLLQPNQKRDESNEPESNVDSTARAPPRPGSGGFPPSLNSQQNDREDKARRQQPKDQPPPKSSVQSNTAQYYSQAHPSDPHPDNMPIGVEGFVHGQMQQQNLDAQGGMQHGMLSDPSHQDYPSVYPQQLPNFLTPVNSNPMLAAPPPFGFPPFPSDGAPPFFGGPPPFEGSRSDSTAETGSDSGSALGYGPGPGPGPGPGGVGFPEGYAWPWGGPPGNVPYDAMQGGQGVMPPPPGPPPRHQLQHKHGYHSGGDIGNDGKQYGWQMDRRDSFGNGQD